MNEMAISIEEVATMLHMKKEKLAEEEDVEDNTVVGGVPARVIGSR